MSLEHGLGSLGGLSLLQSWDGIAVPCGVHAPPCLLQLPEPSQDISSWASAPMSCLCPSCVLRCWVSTKTTETLPRAFLQFRVQQHPSWGPLPPDSSRITQSGTCLPKPRGESLPPSHDCSPRDPSLAFHCPPPTINCTRTLEKRKVHCCGLVNPLAGMLS